MRFVSENNFAALMGTSNSTAQKWAESGVYPSHVVNGIRGFEAKNKGTGPPNCSSSPCLNFKDFPPDPPNFS